jgi:hypothetical protein
LVDETDIPEVQLDASSAVEVARTFGLEQWDPLGHEDPLDLEGHVARAFGGS